MLKRLFDLFFSSIALFILSPLFFAIAISIKIVDKGPVLYKAIRIGKNSEPFEMLKFRTMVVDAEKVGPTIAMSNDRRVTNTGAFLRKYKLDELPQLINVLKGNMSIVGPRPEASWIVEKYSDEQKKTILSVRPGMTDAASVVFFNEGALLSGSKDPDNDYIKNILPSKLNLQMEYVKNSSFCTDLRILKDTFNLYLRGKMPHRQII